MPKLKGIADSQYSNYKIPLTILRPVYPLQVDRSYIGTYSRHIPMDDSKHISGWTSYCLKFISFKLFRGVDPRNCTWLTCWANSKKVVKRPDETWHAIPDTQSATRQEKRERGRRKRSYQDLSSLADFVTANYLKTIFLHMGGCEVGVADSSSQAADRIYLCNSWKPFSYLYSITRQSQLARCS